MIWALQTDNVSISITSDTPYPWLIVANLSRPLRVLFRNDVTVTGVIKNICRFSLFLFQDRGNCEMKKIIYTKSETQKFFFFPFEVIARNFSLRCRLEQITSNRYASQCVDVNILSLINYFDLPDRSFRVGVGLRKHIGFLFFSRRDRTNAARSAAQLRKK